MNEFMEDERVARRCVELRQPQNCREIERVIVQISSRENATATRQSDDATPAIGRRTHRFCRSTEELCEEVSVVGPVSHGFALRAARAITTSSRST
jgi:hypothetical protein